MKNDNYEVIHSADHIRNFISRRFKGRYKEIANRIEFDRKPIINFCNGRSSMSVDRIEYFLNYCGYTLAPVKMFQSEVYYDCENHGRPECMRMELYKFCKYAKCNFDGGVCCRGECRNENDE